MINNKTDIIGYMQLFLNSGLLAVLRKRITWNTNVISQSH